MLYLRAILLLVWVGVMYVTVVAVANYGVGNASDIFSADVAALNWRAQFDVDLLAHMLLVGIWIAWRHKFSVGGIVLGLLCIMGSLFSLLYVVYLSFHHKGNIVAMLVGDRIGD